MCSFALDAVRSQGLTAGEDYAPNCSVQYHGNGDTRSTDDDLFCITRSAGIHPSSHPQRRRPGVLRVLTMGMASLQLRPTARMDDAVSQVPKLMVSVAQYAIQVQRVHV
jgi:hypothetical protein